MEEDEERRLAALQLLLVNDYRGAIRACGKLCSTFVSSRADAEPSRALIFALAHTELGEQELASALRAAAQTPLAGAEAATTHFDRALAAWPPSSAPQTLAAPICSSASPFLNSYCTL